MHEENEKDKVQIRIKAVTCCMQVLQKGPSCCIITTAFYLRSKLNLIKRNIKPNYKRVHAFHRNHTDR